MAEFINFLPVSGQQDVSRTTIISFTILDGAQPAQINTLSATINGVVAISNGSFINGYSGNIASGTNKYVVGIYPKAPNFLPRASQINIHLEVKNSIDALIIENYSFFTSGYATSPSPSPVQDTIIRACDPAKPFFPPTDLGLRLAKDRGVGTEIQLEWLEAYPNDENNVIFYNIYVSTDRDQVFDGYPEFLVSDNTATIGGLRPGDQYFFGVRVAEFNPNYYTISGMIQTGLDLYRYPLTQLDGYLGSQALFVPAESTSGFPNFGILLIGDELIRYTSKQQMPNGFVVASNGRGYGRTYAESHWLGSTIRLYKGKEDGNTFKVQAVPSFQKPNPAVTFVLPDGYGADGYRDGYDGYAFHDGYLMLRQEPFDNITTPGANNDASGDFYRFDYCGTWRVHPRNIMQGQCKGSYFGGAQVRIDADGNRHLVRVSDVRTHMLQREELLLETTGEPFVLIRRMWTGIKCPCVMLRREQQDARCPICFGSGFVQGYVQFFNPRRSDRRILVRVNPASDDLNIVDRGGLEPAYEPDCWTMAFPAIKDRDVLIRFNPDNTEEYRYEVLNVTRDRALFAQSGAQLFKIKRFPKTDIIYQFPALRDLSPRPGSAQTSPASAPGLVSHTHQFVIPDNVNILTYKGATLVSEGHNHIIINGQVQSVLGHTHILPLNL
jgi:hypothetical protein